MIEKNIWQTYETSLEDLPSYAKDSINIWKNKNPSWNHNYMSGPEREHFFKSEFNSEIYDTYMRLPMGVMKAGLWRFGILYIYGGVYSDIDTRCVKPIESWLDQKYDMILDIERDTPWFATQTIASKIGHPILKSSIDLCVERMKNFEVFNHMVHYYTDCSMFTDAIYKFLGVEPYKIHLNKWYKDLNELEITKQYNVFIFGGKNARRLLDKDIRHLYWGGGPGKPDKNYKAWREDPRVNDKNNKRGLENWEE